MFLPESIGSIGKSPTWLPRQRSRITGRRRDHHPKKKTLLSKSWFLPGSPLSWHRKSKRHLQDSDHWYVGSRAPEKGYISDNLHAGNIHLKLIFLAVLARECRIDQYRTALDSTVRHLSGIERKLPPHGIPILVR